MVNRRQVRWEGAQGQDGHRGEGEEGAEGQADSWVEEEGRGQPQHEERQAGGGSLDNTR